ncbi:MAG TPA: nitrite/sulfite reductase, partial [Bacteroidota bacterium]
MQVLIQEHANQIDDPVLLEKDVFDMREAIGRFRSGDLPDLEFRRFRLHRGIYGQRADQPGYSMVRVKVPYGLLTSKQVARLGEIARKFADGIAHITTRQDIQFHWVKLDDVPDVMGWLAETGLTTREACGNTVRNIVGSPLAGVDPNELFDITPYARQLTKHLLRNSLNQQLPRKFKISFSGSSDESDGIIPWIHDIGFVAAVHEVDGAVQRGFKTYVGGGLGSQPRVADLLEDFTPVGQMIPLSEAILTVFNELGNRDNRNKARIKYVLWKVGLEEFRRRVNEERNRILQSGRTFPPPEETPEQGYRPVSEKADSSKNTSAEFLTWAETNVLPQKQTGYHVAYVNPTIGDLTTDQLFALSDIAERYSNGFVRTTAQQDMVLRWVRTSDLQPIYRDLGHAGLNRPGARTITNVTSCPGADTCNLGITHSRALGRTLTQLFERTPDLREAARELRIKISGCPNSCGQHHVASIGFYGATKSLRDREIPSYIMLIAGGFNAGKQSFGEVVGKVPARRVPEAVSRVLRNFVAEKRENENFLEYVEREGV